MEAAKRQNAALRPSPARWGYMRALKGLTLRLSKGEARATG
jgi:hypothetical protein